MSGTDTPTHRPRLAAQLHTTCPSGPDLLTLMARCLTRAAFGAVVCTEEGSRVVASKPKPAYRVLVGIDYPPHKRAEVGDVVDDIPSGSVEWLLEQGVIEKAEAS